MDANQKFWTNSLPNKPRKLKAKDMLEKAYKKALSEVEFQAMANNLSTVFWLLSKTKKQKETNQYEN